MISLKITDDWDIAVDDNGNFCFVNGEEELLQTACHAIYTFRGEDPFNPNNGIPYFEEILYQKTSKKTLLESYMRYEIRNVEGIINLFLLEEDDSDILNNISRNFKSNVYIITNKKEDSNE